MTEEKSSTGLESNIGGLLSYLLGWITGLIFFLIEERDEFVRFHAMQSIIFFGAITVAWIILGFLQWIPGPVGALFTVLISLVALFAFVMWIVLMVKAYQGELFKLPVAGELAQRYSPKR